MLYCQRLVSAISHLLFYPLPQTPTMKQFIKPLVGSLVIVSVFALGVSFSRPANALQDLQDQEQALVAEIEPKIEEYKSVIEQKCALIREAGGECKPDAFGEKIAAAVLSFPQR